MIFEAPNAYTTNEDGEVQLVARTISQKLESRALTVTEAKNRRLLIRGLRLGDFALYVSLTDNNVADEVGYFVTDYVNEDLAEIASYDLIISEPQVYVTRHLARSLQSVNPSDLECFDTSGLINYIDRRYPRRNS
jgi:hypothetical protein